jgi:hypothetical protein
VNLGAPQRCKARPRADQQGAGHAVGPVYVARPPHEQRYTGGGVAVAEEDKPSSCLRVSEVRDGDSSVIDDGDGSRTALLVICAVGAHR